MHPEVKWYITFDRMQFMAADLEYASYSEGYCSRNMVGQLCQHQSPTMAIW